MELADKVRSGEEKETITINPFKDCKECHGRGYIRVSGAKMACICLFKRLNKELQFHKGEAIVDKLSIIVELK